MTGSWNSDGEWDEQGCVDGLILSEVTEQSVLLLSRPFLSVVGHLLPQAARGWYGLIIGQLLLQTAVLVVVSALALHEFGDLPIYFFTSNKLGFPLSLLCFCLFIISTSSWLRERVF